MIASIIHEPDSEDVKTRVRKDVAEVTAKFPMYPTRRKENQTDRVSAT
jgi:glycine/serine hydroxymethyltransferase